MSVAFGNKAFIGFAEESTYGTYVAATKFLEIMEESFVGDRPFISKPSLRNASHMQKVLGKISVKGGFKSQMGFAGFERIFKHALGGSATTGSGPYTHTATLSDNLPTGLSFYIDRDSTNNGGDGARYYGCNIDKLTIRQAIEEVAEIEVSVVGSNWVMSTAETPTFPTLVQADWMNCTSISFNGATLDVKDFEFTLENELATDRYKLASNSIVGLGRKGPRKLSGKFSMERDSVNAHLIVGDHYLQTGTAFTITYTWTNGLAAGALRSITVNANGIISKVEENAKDAGPIMLNVEWDGYATTSNNELTIVTINGSSTI